MDNLKDYLKKFLNSHKNLRFAMQLYVVNSKWNQIVGEQIGSKTYVEKIYKNKLYVVTSSPAWSNQLNMLKPQIIKEIKKTLQLSQINDMQFKTKNIKEIESLKKDLLGEEIDKNTDKIKYEKIDESLEKLGFLGDNLDDNISYKLSRIYTKDKIAKKRRIDLGWNECKICGNLISTSSKICPVCNSNIEEDKKVKIIKYLIETPWIKYEDVKKDYPTLSEEDFRNIKEQYKLRVFEDIKSKTRGYMIDKDQSLRKEIEKFIIRYVMLATCQPPHLITNNIIRKKIGKFYYETVIEGKIRKD